MPSSPTSPTRRSGTRASRPRSASIPGRSDSGPASDSACDWAAGSRRWSTGSPSSSHRPGVLLVGTGSGVSAVDDIRFEPLGGGTRIDYTADIRLGGLLRLVQPFLGRAFATLGAQRRRRHAADARRASAARRRRAGEPGRRGMKVAIVGAGRQRADRCVRPPTRSRGARCTTPMRPSAVTSRRSPWRPMQGRSPSTPGSSSTTSTPTRRSCDCWPSWASRRSPATCRLGSTCRACRVEFSSRGPRGYLATPGVHRPSRALADDGRHPAVLPRCPAHSRPAGHVHGDPGRLPRRRRLRVGLPAPFPGADHVRRLVHRGRPDPGLPDRLPAALPRSPRPHRLWQRAPVADHPGRLDALRRADRGSPAGRDPSVPARP